MINAFCAHPWQRLKVYPDGEVSYCCWMKRGGAGIGNLFRNTLEEIWDGPVARAVRAETLAGRLHPECQTAACAYAVGPRDPRPVADLGYPTALDFDPPNTACNTKCIMCPRSDPHLVPDADRTAELVVKLRPLVPRLENLQVQGLAEVFWKGLLHNVLDMLGYDEHRDRIRVVAFTNGSVLDAAARARYFARVPRSVTFFSLDAADGPTFEAIRRLQWDAVLENFRGFARERGPGQELLTNNNINLLNVHQVGAMVGLAADVGADAAWFNVTDPAAPGIRGKTMHEVHDRRVAGIFHAAQEDGLRVARERGIRVSFTKPLDLGRSGRPPLPRGYTPPKPEPAP